MQRKFKPVSEIASECGETFPPIFKVDLSDKETIAEEHLQVVYLYLEKSNKQHTTKGLARSMKHSEEWVNKVTSTKTYKKMLEDNWNTSLECSDVIVVGFRIPDDPLSRTAVTCGLPSSTKRYRRNE